MTELLIEAGDLYANREERTITGLLVPYGEVGNTNLGKFAIPNGVVQIPADAAICSLNIDHDRAMPVGRATELRNTDRGVVATFSIARTPEGDAALEDAASPQGKRKKLSVEMSNIILRAGELVSGRIFGAALVPKGAFPSATLYAADVDDTTEPVTTEQHTEDTFTDENGVTWRRVTDVETETTDTKTTTTTVETEEVINPESTPDNEKEDAVGEPATAPDTLQAHPAPSGTNQGRKLGDLFAMLAEYHRTRDKGLFATLSEEFQEGGVLYAALSDVKTTGTGGLAPTMSQPQWLGELWAGRRFQRRYIPLFSHGDLNGFSVQGWKWGVKPAMAEWTGNKTAVPSNTPTVTPYSTDAHGFAGGHDIDRRFRDFEVPGFWESYWGHMTDSYAELSDDSAITAVLAGATAVTPGTVPTDIQPGLAAIVDGALAVLDYGLPTFAVVSKEIYRDLLLTPKDKVTEYLTQALNLEEGTTIGFKLVPARGTDLAAGQVLVGIGNAVEILELPGAPIRVEGLDMVKGGIDTGVFGYSAEVIHKPEALALVTLAGGGA